MPNQNPETQITDHIPKSYKIYGNAIYWVMIAITVASLYVQIWILADPDNNVLNPNKIFGQIFNGASPEEIWANSITGGFLGAHFYLSHITQADSWALLLTNIGCGVGLFGLIPAVIYQIVKEKNWFCAILGTILVSLIILSMTGVLSIAG